MIWTGKYFTDYLRPGYSAISYVDPSTDDALGKEVDPDAAHDAWVDPEAATYDPSDERTWSE